MAKRKNNEPETMAFITPKEIDQIMCSVLFALQSAETVRDTVSTCTDFIQKQEAEPGTDMAIELYRCKQEVIFTRLHAESIVESLNCLRHKLINMHQFYTIQQALNNRIKEELILKYNNKNKKKDDTTL